MQGSLLKAGASALAIAVAGVGLTGGATAAEVSEEGAAAIQADLQAWMDEYLFNLPETPYVQNGALEVTAGDGGYDILLPAIDVRMPGARDHPWFDRSVCRTGR